MRVEVCGLVKAQFQRLVLCRVNRAQVARAAVRLRGVQEKLALASVVRESCWTDEEEDSPEERAHWAAVRKDADARVSSWSRDFLAAIRNLELGLMFDEAATISHAVTALPPAKKALFANVGKMLAELKRIVKLSRKITFE